MSISNSSFYFEFVIGKDGSISNLKMVKNYNEKRYRHIVLAFVDMPTWEPAKQNGKPVRVNMVLPIKVHPR